MVRPGMIFKILMLGMVAVMTLGFTQIIATVATNSDKYKFPGLMIAMFIIGHIAVSSVVILAIKSGVFDDPQPRLESHVENV
jgi:hypothetical protein